MSRKKLVVCGDSFMSPSSALPGTHFSEIVSRELDLELIPLSRSAMSNGGIVSQLEYASTIENCFILFNTTFADRIEFNLSQDNLEERNEKVTCLDFYYGNRKDLSCREVRTQSPILGSESIESLVGGDFFTEKKESFDLFLKNIYNRNWKIQTDRNLIYSSAHQIYSKAIPFLMVIDIIGASNIMNWLPMKNLGFEWKILDKIRLENADGNFTDPGYHTTPDVQIRVAEDTIERIKKLIQ